jgi:hypothetical protein
MLRTAGKQFQERHVGNCRPHVQVQRTHACWPEVQGTLGAGRAAWRRAIVLLLSPAALHRVVRNLGADPAVWMLAPCLLLWPAALSRVEKILEAGPAAWKLASLLLPPRFGLPCPGVWAWLSGGAGWP